MRGLTISDETLKQLAELDEAYEQWPEKRPRIAEKACDLLQSLAPWWLTADALGQAVRAGRAPTNDVDPATFTCNGLARIVCVWPWHLDARVKQRRPGQHDAALLRDACVLPVRWVLRRNAGTGQLPRALVELASRVQSEVHEAKLLGDVPEMALEWCLGSFRLAAPIEFDEATVRLELGSGFMPLAAALVVSARGGDPRPEVWATGAWNDEFNFCENVSGVAQKVRAALSFGASEFYVPAGNYVEAAEASEGKAQIHPFSVGQRLDRVLSPLIVACRARPPENAPYEDKLRYFYYTADYDHATARRYYTEALLDHVANSVRQQLPAELRALAEGQCALVTVASQSPAVALLAVRVFRPERIILMYDDNRAAERVSCAVTVRGHQRVIPVPFGRDHLTHPEQVGADVARHMEGLPAVVDLTPGSKSHTLALYHAPIPRAVRVYLQNRWTEPPRPGARGIEDPRTMQYVVVAQGSQTNVYRSVDVPTADGKDGIR